ncbi:propionyl-CoA synthetase [Salinispirillum sp. LH 10-3-1]|uniref:Propionyl-CoA synthetase n=1 Tax=Salinispirillum sp. LH 10-3-1 TaxID=2952525 RepID=A0AB38YK09_9GAMM
MTYNDQYELALHQPEAFWDAEAARLPWFKAPQKIISQDEHGIARWFADGEMNTCYMALDHHVQNGRADQVAIYYDSPVTDQKRAITYQQLLEDTALFAGVLRNQGVEKGDTVVIYMPMIPEALVAMLAVARLGAIHSVVFGGFAPHELAVRIDDVRPKVVVSASCGIEIAKVIPYKPLLDEALAQANYPAQRCIIFQRPEQTAALQEPRDIDWQQAMTKAEPVGCTPVSGTDPLYVLYTSGTTGKPKGVQRDNGGHAVALNFAMRAVYDMKPGEVFWAASDIGWVVGHSFILYAPLIAGCSTVLYEGKPVRTPDASAFWRVCAEYRVKALFAAPTAFRAIKKEDPNAEGLRHHDLSALTYIFVAGERLDPPTYDWISEKTGKPVIDHWWQTETGWPVCANLMGIEPKPTKAGSATFPVPGYQVAVLDEAGQPVPTGEQGAIALRLPLPPGCLATLWQDHERYQRGYLETYPGYYLTGDGGYCDADGYVFIMGRIDDVINVAGHRLSTGEMEEIIAAHPAVAECAVIGMPDDLKGQKPLGLVVLKDGADITEAELERVLVEHMRHNIGAVACFHHALQVARLPKTRSGKILRKLLRQIAAGEAYTVPSTIDDPACLPEIQQALVNRCLLEPADLP